MDQNKPDDSTGSEQAQAETGVDTESNGETDTASTETDGDTNTPDEQAPSGRREVIVPLRLYKTITVFSTLIAIGGILVGFILLDVATNRTQAELSEVNILVAVLGIGLIAGGAITYAFSTRFRTAGMGNAKDDADEHSDTDNG